MEFQGERQERVSREGHFDTTRKTSIAEDAYFRRMGEVVPEALGLLDVEGAVVDVKPVS
jgi:hypothetical protein